ncbi:hypothetical protein [Sinomicrobium pectinilyticum]|nr:hypothetical protein [Sinomicrobium pectinilyticum]
MDKIKGTLSSEEEYSTSGTESLAGPNPPDIPSTFVFPRGLDC